MVKISKYEKLKQLDRIEYLLLKERIGTMPIFSTTFSVLNAFIWIFLYMYAMVLLEIIGFRTYYILNAVPNMLIVFKIALMVCIMVDAMIFINWYGKDKWIKKRFFKNGK